MYMRMRPTRPNCPPRIALSSRPPLWFRNPDWEEKELIPFLRYAFAHVQPHAYDYVPHVQKAYIMFELKRKKVLEIHVRVTFDRVFLAVMHRHNNLDKEAAVIANNPDNLAFFLVYGLQKVGPYDILGRRDRAVQAAMESRRRRWEALQNARRGQEVLQKEFVYMDPNDALCYPRKPYFLNMPAGWLPDLRIKAAGTTVAFSTEGEGVRRDMPPPPRPRIEIPIDPRLLDL